MSAAVQAPHTLSGSDAIAGEAAGVNFFTLDSSLRSLLPVYMPDELREHMWPHYERLGALAGGRLDELARTADRYPPVLHPRDRFGRDEEWIEHHPAYHEMEAIAYGELGLQAMSHRAGVLGWSAPVPPIAKYMFQYLFVQAEFGLMCPVSVSDTAAFLLKRYGDEALKEQYLPGMLSQDMSTLLRGTQFMTEKAAGSDVGKIETVARLVDGEWRLYGDKWFCSHADADVAMILARPEGAAAGTRGLGMFLLPRHRPDGTRNAYRIVRLKDKLGTRSMASGEIRLEGALVHPVGDLQRGLKQMLDQVNLSRLSHGMRAASMMRRCLNEALACARSRPAFGGFIENLPLVQRELLKMQTRTEHALSVCMFAASVMGQNDGDSDTLLRILTPLVKYGACRDNVEVATAAMEMRGGNGYIEDWVNPRLIRDAQVGLLWEGTSNINALDVVQRAIAKVGAHQPLTQALEERLNTAQVAAPLRERALGALQRANAFAQQVGQEARLEHRARDATRLMYDAVGAALMIAEDAELAATGNPHRRAPFAEWLLASSLEARDPYAL